MAGTRLLEHEARPGIYESRNEAMRGLAPAVLISIACFWLPLALIVRRLRTR